MPNRIMPRRYRIPRCSRQPGHPGKKVEVAINREDPVAPNAPHYGGVKGAARLN
jgi:hypothetical protein